MSSRDDVFEKDPVNLIRLYWVADRSGLNVHPEATRLVTQSLKRINAALRADPDANRLFLEILTSRRSPEMALRRMNEAGVLGSFIPDFGRVVGMMQFSMYHHYTVDEHLFRTVGVLSQIERGWLKEDLRCCREILPAYHASRPRSMSPPSCMTSPRVAASTIRSPARKSRASSARASA